MLNALMVYLITLVNAQKTTLEKTAKFKTFVLIIHAKILVIARTTQMDTHAIVQFTFLAIIVKHLLIRVDKIHVVTLEHALHVMEIQAV